MEEYEEYDYEIDEEDMDEEDMDIETMEDFGEHEWNDEDELTRIVGEINNIIGLIACTGEIEDQYICVLKEYIRGYISYTADGFESYFDLDEESIKEVKQMDNAPDELLDLIDLL